MHFWMEVFRKKMSKHWDTVLLRAKDILLIVGAVGAVFVFSVKFYSLPPIVEANTIAIEKLKEVDDSFNLKLMGIDKDLGFISKTVSELNDNLKRRYRSDFTTTSGATK